jgi:hypothetical protein
MVDDVQWMTYTELAEALGIGPDSARNLVRRKRWPRMPGNDGLARIGVPVEHLAQHVRPDAPGETLPEVDASPPIDLGAAIAALERHIERLERELAAAVVERNAERTRALQVPALEAMLEVERQRVRDAREEAERWRQLATRPIGLWAWLKGAGVVDRGLPRTGSVAPASYRRLGSLAGQGATAPGPTPARLSR